MCAAITPHGRAFAEEGAAEAWRRATPGRAAYLAQGTARMFALAHLTVGARVLVIGGGTGDEAIAAAELVGSGGSIVMTDLSPGMVVEATKAMAEAGHPEVRCQVMDAQSLDFPDGEFDAVVARNVLMFIPDLHRGLTEMRRVLRRDGRLVGSTWSSPKKNPRLSIPVAAAATVGVTVPADTTLRLAQRLSRPDGLAAQLRRAGFRQITVDKVPAIARPADWAAFLADLRDHAGTREVAQLIPDDRRERFWRSLDRRFLAHRPSGELNGEQLVLGASA